MKKSAFFDFLNRRKGYNFESFLAEFKEDIDYIDWNGYCLPMTYGDAELEYRGVRNACALFDASPVKKYRISGKDAGAFLDSVMTRQVSNKKSMRVIYATFCNEDGMLRDDGLLYKFSHDHFLLMVSELDHDEYFARVLNQFNHVKISEMTSFWSGLAFQGPQSCAVLKNMGFTTVKQLKPFEINMFPFKGREIIIARVGFTADLGYELWFAPELNNEVEKAVNKAETEMDIQIHGYGLEAMNALRIEGGFIVPGWDSAQIFEDNEFERTPAELGIAWTVDLHNKQNFIGKKALLKEKSPRFKTIGVSIDSESDIQDGVKLYSNMNGRDVNIGTILSVAWSWGLDCWLGIASIRSNCFGDDLTCHVLIGEKKRACTLVQLPFVKFDRYRKIPAPV